MHRVQKGWHKKSVMFFVRNRWKIFMVNT